LQLVCIKHEGPPDMSETELYRCALAPGELLTEREARAHWGKFWATKIKEHEMNGYEGGGILGVDHDHDQIRQEQELFRAAGGTMLPDSQEVFTLLDEAVAARNHKAETSARDTELQSRYDRIDRLVTKHLKPELEAEFERREPTAADKRRFAEFRAYCEEHGYQALPADPQPVVSYLVNEQAPKGAAHVIRSRRAISRIHRAVNFPDPCNDLAVKALIRKISNRGHQPETEETNGNL